MGVPTGSNIGRAVGRVEIDTSQAQQAPVVMRGVAQGINQAMSSVGASTNRAQASIGALTGAARGLAGAFGIGLGVQAFAQLATAAVDASKAADAFDRQVVAARSLAGSQQQVNKLLEAYDKATGGAVDKATALQAVTRLQAIGFADTTKELDQFARAVRGIRLAMGQSQEYITGQLQLAIANQSTMRLDQIGLGVAEVQKRVADLRAENSALTKEMAYQQAVLGLAEEKYGALANSVEGQATGTERLSKAWKDNNLVFGQIVQGPINAMATALAKMLENSTKSSENFLNMLKAIEDQLRKIGVLGIDMSSPIASRTSIGRVQPKSFADDPLVSERRQVHLDWAKGVDEVNDQLHDNIIDAERDYGRQRADAVKDYIKGVAREERDFQRGRLRDTLDHLDSIADIYRDATRRESKAIEALNRQIGKEREDANERLAELDEDYQRNREKAARDHRDNLLDAAGKLDAKAVAEAQRNFKRQEEDAKESHDKQRSEIKERLQEQIDEANEAHTRQLQDAREADAQRIADMKEDFAKRQALEDEDRAIRNADRAQDQADQLAAMDTAHADRLAQIEEHAAEERAQLEEEANAALKALGVRNKAYDDMVARREAYWESLWDKFMGKIETSLGGTPGTIPPGFGEADAPPGFAMGSGSSGAGALAMRGSRSIIVGDVNVHVGGTNASASDIGSAVRYELSRILDEVAA